MKRPAFRGFTAAGVLVLAIAAGAAGGAVAYSAAQGNPAPAVPAVSTLHQVADEAIPSPTPSAAAAVVDEKPAPAVEVVHPASTKVVAAPAPAVEGESASAAADRATAEADRASDAADRAEKAEQPAAPAPEPKVVATPAAPAPVEEQPVAQPKTDTPTPVTKREDRVLPDPRGGDYPPIRQYWGDDGQWHSYPSQPMQTTPSVGGTVGGLGSPKG